MISMKEVFKDDHIYTRKKAEYTFYFLILIFLYASVQNIVASLITGFKVEVFIAYCLWFLLVGFITLLLSKKKLEAAINFFILAGLSRALMLYNSPLGLHFFIHVLLIVFVISAIKLKWYQLHVTLLVTYLLITLKSIEPTSTIIFSEAIDQVSFRISMIIGALMFYIVLYYLSRKIDNEINKLDYYEKLIRTDVLTGISNRFSFFEDAKELKEHQSILLLDLDYFKTINDEFGHPVGDQILKSFSALLKDYLNAFGKIYRIGGEEFAIILNSEKAQAYEVVCQEIVDLINNHDFHINKKITTSIGAFYIPDNAIIDIHQIYKICDQRLYRAKEAGRNTYYAT